MRDGRLIDQAMQRAVNEAIREHRLRGLPMVIQRDGEIIWVPAEEMELLDDNTSTATIGANAGRDVMTSQRDSLTVIGQALIDGALTAFKSNKGWADKAIAQLPDDKLHVALDPNTNSIAVIMKHVTGNLLSRWTDFLTTDGEKLWRNRDAEFTDTFTSRNELISYWDSGWQRVFESLQALSVDDLKKTVAIRGEPHSVPLAIQRSLAHCGYHVGQIVLVARILAGDHWTTITIPRGASASFNQQVWGKGHYQAPK